ncbi:MAG: excinuclease subunit UvrB [Planctomycetota bacterium]|jgi:excinuclease ABC subunit B
MSGFRLHAPYEPTGDQPAAIDRLVDAFAAGTPAATLLGVTGSGKTFTMANVIARLGRPALLISHNKTLAAQLYAEMKGFFPDNAVEYFVSYYDYYQPEAYVPGKDLYIEKEATINEELDKLRLSATRSLLSRRDVVIVASVSAIYGLGSPTAYQDLTATFAVGQAIAREAVVRALIDIQYQRGDLDFHRGRFRVRGDTIDLWPAYDDTAIRISMFGDEIEAITTVHTLTGEVLGRHERIQVYPAKHFVVSENTLDQALGGIRAELDQRHAELMQAGALVEAQRLLSRTKYDLDLLQETGTCPGIENYSRHLTGRAPGERPYCLYDFFPPDSLVIIDESHVTIPQLGGMYAGDRSRKETLVRHGFRLPSALDNRPLRFPEWEDIVGLTGPREGQKPQVLFVSATPGPYEAKLEKARVEQLVRPTGVTDPIVHIRPTAGQVEDLIREVRARVQRGERALVTTLTKRLAEDLSEYLAEAGVRTAWLHSDLDALERIEILRDLRAGRYDCLVGVNLLREGLDLPEVSLVCIFDADKEGFLRSQTSLIQTIGRAARHVAGEVVLYADGESPAMRAALDETARRRAYQIAYNERLGITPRSATKAGDHGGAFAEQLAARAGRAAEPGVRYQGQVFGPADIPELTVRMTTAAEELKFEEAAKWRDLIHRIESDGQAADAGGGDEGPRKPKAKGRRRGRR